MSTAAYHDQQKVYHFVLNGEFKVFQNILKVFC